MLCQFLTERHDPKQTTPTDGRRVSYRATPRSRPSWSVYSTGLRLRLAVQASAHSRSRKLQPRVARIIMVSEDAFHRFFDLGPYIRQSHDILNTCTMHDDSHSESEHELDDDKVDFDEM